MLLVMGGVFRTQMSHGLALTGDPEAGRKLAMQYRACTGSKGHAKMLFVPHIGGENHADIEHQLTAFRTSNHTHDVMGAIAGEMTNDEVPAVAERYSAIRFEVKPAE